jgi:hypothetical protein
MILCLPQIRQDVVKRIDGEVISLRLHHFALPGWTLTDINTL